MNGGGPSLDLRDIHPAPDPGWWPPAPGWWLLALLALLLLAWLGRLAWRHYRRRQQRRRVLAEVERLLQETEPERLAGELQVLLKRVALARYPAGQVAGLHGEPWLAFLDRSGGNGHFRDGPGRVLLHAPYARGAPVAVDELGTLVRAWVRANS